MKLTVFPGEKFATLLPRAVSQKVRSSASSSFSVFVHIAAMPAHLVQGHDG
jgi:hypothetical protein